MVDVSIIEREIAALLDEGETDFETCGKLAMLYTVRDHIVADQPRERTESDFLRACEGKDPARVLEVMDELMGVQEVTCPRAYAEVMGRIQAL